MFSTLIREVCNLVATLLTTVVTICIVAARLDAVVINVDVGVSVVIDGVFSSLPDSIEPGKPDSEVDNDQGYSHQQEEHVLDDGTNVAAESHVATLLGIVKVSSIVVIRCLHAQSD